MCEKHLKKSGNKIVRKEKSNIYMCEKHLKKSNMRKAFKEIEYICAKREIEYTKSI